MQTSDKDEQYQPGRRFESKNVFEFMDAISNIDGNVDVFWRSAKEEIARPGIWMRRGKYKLKHGSFVDPWDLSCYAAQFYVADDKGIHDCVQIGHTSDVPEDAVEVETVCELRSAVAELTPEFNELRGDDCGAAADAAAGSDAAIPEEDADSAFPEHAFKLLQPDAAFELHGSLTKGWTATEYVFQSEDGSMDTLLVFD